MRVNRILSAVLLTWLAAMYVAWWSTGAGAAVVGQDYVIAKGFVAARNDTTLTLLESNRRIVVTVSPISRQEGGFLVARVCEPGQMLQWR